MAIKTGDWGCIHDIDYVDDNDKNLFDAEHLAGATMQCRGVSGDEATLVLGDDVTITVNTNGVEPRSVPEFTWGDNVRVRSKGIIGSILEICWHRNKKLYFYHIESDGKKLKKRYFADELEGC